MKKYMMILVLGALMACLVPAQAQSFKTQTTQQQQQEWKTATMQGSGSAYSSQVTAVGATQVSYQATTTTGGSNNLPGGGPRKSFGDNTDPGDTTETGSPIGDAMLPLVLMGMVYAFFAWRRKEGKAA